MKVLNEIWFGTSLKYGENKCFLELELLFFLGGIGEWGVKGGGRQRF